MVTITATLGSSDRKRITKQQCLSLEEMCSLLQGKLCVSDKTQLRMTENHWECSSP